MPVSLPLVAVAGLAGAFFLCANSPTARSAAWIGWVTGAAYFALTLHWIVEPFFVDAPRHGWMAPFALIFLAGGLALFWAGAFAIARRAARGLPALVLALPAALTLAEWLRGWVFTGFPWATIGYVWTETPLLQVAAWVGPYGLTWLTLTAAALTALPFLSSRLPAPLAAVPILGVLGAVAALALPPPAPLGGRPVVRLIQPNAPQDQKWDPAHALTFYDRQLEFTAAPGDPALTVWPETAIPWLFEGTSPALAQIADAAGGAPVVVGLQRRDQGRLYNSLVSTGPDGTPTAQYDKHHLVPFGEYLPFATLSERLGIVALAATLSGFSPGPGPRVIAPGGIGTALPLICYEAIFPRNIRRAPTRPDTLLHITNDAWFGQTAGPQQHLAQVRARAVEFGLPVIRVANTGISAVIDARGRVLTAIPLGTAGFVDTALPPAAPPTVYARFGDNPVILALLLLLGGAAARLGPKGR